MQLKGWQRQELIKIFKAKKIKKGSKNLYHIIFENFFEIEEEAFSDPEWFILCMKRLFDEEMDQKLKAVKTLVWCDSKKEWDAYKQMDK